MISVDSTRLGPALGGCRIKAYPRWQDGLNDVLRLSVAMTEKAALAGLAHGGGKTVVALTEGSSADWTGARRGELLADIGDLVEDLGGRYWTGPDIGTGPADMAEIHRRTQRVFCRPEAEGGSGDSSGPTALGVQSSIRAVVEHRWPGRELSTLSFAVIGLGHVGSLVGAWLAENGSRLTVSDVNPALKTLARQWGADWATPEQALAADVDVLVPCATGGILTAASTASLNCAVIVGAANNQLDHPATAERLCEHGVLWAPDSVVSAGGIIAAVARELHGATAAEAEQQVRGIGGRLTTTLEDARARQITPLAAAAGLVDLRLRTGR